jgi:hypothetical protein
MPTFCVDISGENLDLARRYLDGRLIPTRGSFAPRWDSEQQDAWNWADLNRLEAVLDAETAEKAEARVRDALPADAGYSTDHARLHGGEGSKP